MERSLCPTPPMQKADASFKVNVKVLVERKTIDYIKRLDRYEEAENIRNVGSYQAPARTARKWKPALVKKTINTI